MRIIYDNLIDLPDNVITASSDVANFEEENIQDTRLSRTWRTTGIISEDIVIDAGMSNTFTVDSVAIFNHNFTSSVTLKFQMNATDSWGAPSVDETLVWRDGAILKFITESTYRYIRVSIADATNTDGFIELGRLVAGGYLQVTPSSISEFLITNVRTDIVQRSITNQVYADEGVGLRVFQYDFPPTEFTMIQSLRDMWDTVGKHKPFVFMNFDTDYTFIEPAYLVFDQDFEEQFTRVARISYSFIMSEAG